MFPAVPFLALLTAITVAFPHIDTVGIAREPTEQAPLLVTSVSDNKTRVPVVLGVMSRCLDALICESVFDDALPQIWDIVDINLSFVGTINPVDPEYGVTCKHGPIECEGNVQELCAISYAPSQEDWWHFVQCLNYEGKDRVGDKALAARCAGVNFIPWEDELIQGTIKKGIKGCIEGQEGKELLKKSVLHSMAMGITKSCTIVINGQQRCVHDGSWKDCETGHTAEEIVKYIRDEYKNPHGNASVESDNI